MDRQPSHIIDSKKPEVLLWLFSIANLTDFHWNQIEKLLTDKEKEVALRKRHSAIYKASQAISRLALGKLLQTAPLQLRFETHEKGKPYLPHFPQCGFNVSHSGEWIAFAATNSTTTIGVDIEYHRQRDFVSIAENYFHKEEIEALKHTQNVQSLFFQYWTLKEAFFKALGSGIVTGLEKINLANYSLGGKFHIDETLLELEHQWSLHYEKSNHDDQLSLAIAVKNINGFQLIRRDFLTDLASNSFTSTTT